MPDSVLKIDLNQTATTPPIAVDQSAWFDVTRRIAVKGDQQAFEVFYNAYFETMFVVVRNTSGRDEQSCLDIVQEAMLKAIHCMKPMDSASQLTAWCKAVAKSATYDWLRKQIRQRKLELAGAKPERDLRNSNQQDVGIEDAARLVWVEQQLRELPKDLQTMISLKYRLGWTLKQIATQFGLKTGAVDGRIRRAIENIKSRVDEDLP